MQTTTKVALFMFAVWVPLAVAVFGRGESQSVPLMDRIVCDANAPGEALDELGQYGNVTAQTCYRNSFNGEKVLVVFVD